jgi:hypothetical protein
MTSRRGGLVLLLIVMTGCTVPASGTADRPPAADPAVAGARRAFVVSNGQVVLGTPVIVAPAAATSLRPTRPSTVSDTQPSRPPGAQPGQSAAARTLSQAAETDDPGEAIDPEAAAPVGTPLPTERDQASTYDAAGAASPSPSPQPTLRPAYPPPRYPRLTIRADRIIVRDRAHDAAGFYRSDSLTPGPPGLAPPPDPAVEPPDAESAAP